MASPTVTRIPYASVVTPDTEVVVAAPTKGEKVLNFVIGVPGIIIGALIGIGIGIMLQQVNASDELVSWVALPGDLFIRALKCLVAPLVFCSIVTGMSDMLAVGKASSIGWRTALAYTFTTLCASLQGLMWVLIFRNQFKKNGEEEKTKPAIMAFKCSNGTYLTYSPAGEVTCSANAMTDGKFNGNSTFMAEDINGIFKKSTTELAKLSLSESFQMQLKQMVPSNITAAFAESALLSIVMFAIPFGVALALLPKSKTYVLEFFREMNLIFMVLIKGVIVLTSFCLISLLSGSLSGQDDLGQLFSDVGVYVGCVVVGMLGHVYIFLPTVLFIMTRTNVFRYYRHIFPAQIFALSCASSMATLPVSMKCIDATKEVSQTLSRFVLSLGSTINMDGAAIYFPAAIVFMAETASIGDKIGVVEFVLIAIVSTIGAVGTAPVPSAAIVMIMTVWSSVLPSVPVPDTINYVIAADFILDRFSTMTNVSGDAIIARVVASMVGEDALDEVRESLASIENNDYLADKEALKSCLENDRLSNPRNSNV